MWDNETNTVFGSDGDADSEANADHAGPAAHAAQTKCAVLSNTCYEYVRAGVPAYAEAVAKYWSQMSLADRKIFSISNSSNDELDIYVLFRSQNDILCGGGYVQPNDPIKVMDEDIVASTT